MSNMSHVSPKLESTRSRVQYKSGGVRNDTRDSVEGVGPPKGVESEVTYEYTEGKIEFVEVDLRRLVRFCVLLMSESSFGVQKGRNETVEKRKQRSPLYRVIVLRLLLILPLFRLSFVFVILLYNFLRESRGLPSDSDLYR